MKKVIDTKKLLFENMVKLNPDFQIKESYEEPLSSIANVNQVDPISAAKTKAKQSQDWIKDAIEYVGGLDAWNKLSPEEQSQVQDIVTKSDISEKTDKWIQKAVNPEHKGYCTPMTKPTCTPARKALAKRFKKGIEDEAYGTPDPLGTNMAKQVNEDPRVFNSLDRNLKRDTPEYEKAVAKHYASQGSGTKILRTHDVLNNFDKAIRDFYSQLIADRVEPKEAIGHITQNFNMIIKELQ